MNSRSILGACLLTLAALGALPATARAAPSYAVTDRLKGPDGGWDLASFDAGRARVYLARSGGVTVVDVAAKSLTTLTIAPGTGRMHAAVPLDGGAMLLVTDGAANVAHLIDAHTGAAISDVSVGQKPDAALFEPASGLAAVMNGHSGDVTLIDPAARKPVATIAIGGSLEIATTDGQGRLFVNVEDQNQIAVIDTRARKLVGRYALAGCDGPTGIAYAANAGVLISSCANKVAKVIDAATGADLGTLTIGAGPDSVLYDPVRKLVFIPCGRDGVLEVIAVAGPKDVSVIQRLPTQIGARTGALDPSSGAIYLPTAKYQPVANGKPAPTPGTFEILVVTPSAGG
jgi:DNA-binding beta-propeller fold protein YncE